MGLEVNGILIPSLTPFNKNGTYDEITLRELINFYLDKKIHGLFILGSSGQGPALSSDEREKVAEIIVDENDRRVPIIVHVGCADTPTTVSLALHAEKHGADAIGLIPPYYYSDAPQQAIIDHFCCVAEATQLPIFIYENPKYCGISVSPQFALKLKNAVPSICGIKVAYGAGAMTDYRKYFPTDVSIFTGNADIFGLVPFGVSGMINPPTSAVPELCVSLYDALKRKDYVIARNWQEKVNRVTQVFIETQKQFGRGTLAEMFRLRGIDIKRFPRWNSDPIPEDAVERIRCTLEDVGIEGLNK